MKMLGAVSGSICLLASTACIPPIPDLTPKLYLHPVKGPMVNQHPNAAITGFSTGIGSGSISFQLPSGESCKGPWEPIPQDQAGSNLASYWDLVYGEGYFTRHVLGSKWRGKSKITGDKGSEFQLEFYRGAPKDSPLLGVATDAAGNVYKVTQ
ncbi:MAG TPA: hypothetical protein VJ528_06795 [Geothrix sp.]|uniref:hypothetical protein n=1 Tax=Geothrix mesophila TaxID=2922723 RepID=UPI001FAC01F3|nr:hypothetical protein [Geothrix sp. SG198]HJV38527.1 hypothetical protein [Geothrix sp.]